MPIPLLDPSVAETVRRIRRKVIAIDGVEACDVQIDSAGKKPHVNLRILLGHTASYERIHRISSMADHEVRRILPNARVMVRSASEAGGRGDIEEAWELVKRIADRESGSRGAHNIHLQNVQGHLGIDFHLEVSSELTVREAHQVAKRIEEKLKAANPKISEVVIHEETISDRVSSERSGHGSELRWYIDHVVRRFPDAKLSRPPTVRRLGEGQIHVIMHVSFPPEMSMEMADQVMTKLEAAIRSGHPKIARLDVVNEPSENGAIKQPTAKPSR